MDSPRRDTLKHVFEGGPYRMAKIEFGYVIPSGVTEDAGWAAYREDASRWSAYLDHLDRHLALLPGAFDSAWMVDHIQTDSLGELESFTSIAYLAARYPRLDFGSSVLCQSFRSPALLAKMGATLQLLSGGRFILGLGAGWHEGEHLAYGYDFPSNRVRVEQTDEALRIIRALWTGEEVTFSGKYHRVQEAFCRPKPDPLPPVMLGAFKPKMLRLAAQYADWWNVSSTGPRAFAALSAALDRACSEVGRLSPIRRTWGGGLACAATREQAETLAGDRFSATNNEEDFGFVGTPRQIVEQMRRFVDLGVDLFIFNCQDYPGLDGLERVLDRLSGGPR